MGGIGETWSSEILTWFQSINQDGHHLEILKTASPPISNNMWHDYRILTALHRVHAIYLFSKCITKSCDPPDWLIQTCYQSASSHVTETAFCGKCFQKCCSVENLFIVSLNTVIPIIVNVYLPNVS